MEQIKRRFRNHLNFKAVEWGNKQLEICPITHEDGPIGSRPVVESFHNSDDNHIRLFVEKGTKYFKLVLVNEQNKANNRYRTELLKTEDLQNLLDTLDNVANTLHERFKINKGYQRQIAELQLNITSDTSVVINSLKSGHKTNTEKIWNKF